MKKIRIEPDGSIIYDTVKYATIFLDKDETRKYINYKGEFPTHPKGRSAPLIAHLEVTDRCNTNCPYCYNPSRDANIVSDETLDTEQWKDIIFELAYNGIFQITFGGGEPLVRNDLFELAKYAKEMSLTTGLTTNGILVREEDRNDPKWDYIDQVNISYHPHLNGMDVLNDAVDILRDRNKVGINFVLSENNMSDLWKVLSVVDKYEPNEIEILLLSYKSVVPNIDKQLSRKRMYDTAVAATSLGFSIAIDTNIAGQCEGGYGFIDIGHDGSVYPCSFVREPVGNILTENFADIWRKVPTLKECPY